MIKYKKSIFLFTKDFRLIDNTGLLFALQNSSLVIPIFIFTSVQLTDKNKYRSDKCVKFMIESLIDLNKHIKIHFFYGDTITILKDLCDNDKNI